MKRRWISAWLFAALLPAAVVVAAEPVELPLADGRPVFAAVNGVPITEDSFMRNLAAMHAGAENAQDARDRQDPTELLRRLINVELVVQEARNIGLDELPAIEKAVENYRKDALRLLIFDRQTRDIVVDPREVEPRFKEEVQEIQVDSLIFGAKEDADAFAGRLADGEAFDSAARETIETGAAESGDDGQFLRVSELQPQVAEVAAKMQVGAVSPPIEVGDKHVVFMVREVRYADDPEARGRIEAEIYRSKRVQRLDAFTKGLRDKYVKLDQELLDGLDYEAEEPGFDKLAEDARVLAGIEGEAPVLVSDLTQALRKEFFHGIEGAIAAKRVNARKEVQLERILQSRTVMHEARRLELAQSPEYQAMIEEFENGLLFGRFVEKIVEPEIQFSEDEMKAYFEEHADEFSSPELQRIESLAFTDRDSAESALAKLRSGVDFEWMRANADGLTDPEQHPDLLAFPKSPVVTETLPLAVREAVSGAASGDYRLHVAGDGVAYVLRIRTVVAPERQPYQEVRKTIARRLYDRKRTETLEEWIDMLREASEIEVFATPEALQRMLHMPGAQES